MPCIHKEALKAIEKAHNMVGDLAAGRKRWIMTVPVRDDDTDMILADALIKAKEALECKPRTITIPQSELPEPMREEPAIGSYYFTWKKLGLSVCKYRWDGDSSDKMRLNACLSFHTEEDARAWRDWWRENVMGRG